MEYLFGFALITFTMASVRDVDELLNEVSLEDHSDEKLAQLILKEAAAVEKKMKEEEVDRKKYTHNLTWRGKWFLVLL